MKITRRQLKQIVKETISLDVEYLDSIGSQEMADAKRAAGEDPAAQAAYLGIGVEDWYTIRQELDDHYEDRHQEDQMAYDDWYDLPELTPAIPDDHPSLARGPSKQHQPVDDDPDTNNDGVLDAEEISIMVRKIKEDL